MPAEAPPLAPRWAGVRRFASKTAAVAILAGVGVGAGALLTPGLAGQRIPYDDRSLGQIATTTVKATRDYDIPDEETTAKKREDAVAQVRPVYDLDGTVLPEVDSRVRDAFTSMRAALAPAPAGAATDAPEKPVRRPAPPPPAVLEALRGAFVAKLQASVDPRDFEILAREGFSPDAERMVLDLVAREMAVRPDVARLLVSDRDLLGNDRERGIFVRPLPGGAPGGEVVTDLDSIRDLAAARVDLERAAFDLPGTFTPAVRRALARLSRGALRPNLTYDSAETERRRQDAFHGVKPVVIQIKKGEKIIGDGERIEERHLLEFRGMRAQARPEDIAQARLGGGLFAALLVLLAYRFGRRQLRRFAPRRKDALFLGLLLLSSLLLAALLTTAGQTVTGRAGWLPVDAFVYAIPVAAGAMLVRLCLGPELALLFAVVAGALFGILEGASLSFALFAMAGSILAADRVGRAASRAGVMRAGLWAGVGNSGLIACFALFGGRLWTPGAGAEMAAGLVGGAILSPILTLALIPAAEGIFAYTTDLRLARLANLNHPALKELIVKAPGTYHHSIILGSLVEAASEAIGANPLLARVCAYYHDIGKGKNPLAFGENLKGEGRHESLSPEESADLIRKHVQDGLDLARQHRLPRAVADAIRQHHGTRLVGDFLERARERRGTSEVDAGPFRYDGPKPSTRETALVMLGDGVEAASRSLPRTGGEELAALVREVIRDVVADGQLDGSDLTLGELESIGRSFTQTLAELQHARPTAGAGPQRQAELPLPLPPTRIAGTGRLHLN